MIDSFMSGEFLFFGLWGGIIGTFIFYIGIPIAIDVYKANKRFKLKEENDYRDY